MRRRVLSLGVATALAVGVLAVVPVAGAEMTETPPRPAHIHVGACPAPGDVIQDLSFLTAVLPSIEHSSKQVAMALSDILAEPHAFVVHLSAEEIGTYLVCGDITGTPSEMGDVAVTLAPVNDSGRWRAARPRSPRTRWRARHPRCSDQAAPASSGRPSGRSLDSGGIRIARSRVASGE
jgi:hypothetical protein